MFKGKHLIGGEWVSGTAEFESSPVIGPGHKFALGTKEDVDKAVHSAEDAFLHYSRLSGDERAAFLRTIARKIDELGEAITEIGCQETGYPAARLETERARTTGQLNYFADIIEKTDYLDCRHTVAQPDRQPIPRPDIRLMQRPVGPVAVFGASNFPLAFSVAGGDTASALAAGCSVVVKGHPAHPGTGELAAQAIDLAIKETGIHPGVFSLIQDSPVNGFEASTALVEHPYIKAVGFTGSLKAGRALFNLCANREEPVPFFGELGSINPGFVFPHALAARGKEIAEGWASSLTLGVGQFCTNPGIMVLPAGEDADNFIEAAKNALSTIDKQPMLTEGIAIAYTRAVEALKDHKELTVAFTSTNEGRFATPGLFVTTGEKFLNSRELSEEVFGPCGIIVIADNLEEFTIISKNIEGQLTCTLHMNEEDSESAASLLPILERKAGRLIANNFPTGVEVCDAMVHGGPYPASTNFGATSVGGLAIRRFLRPVSYQNFPEQLLPECFR